MGEFTIVPEEMPPPKKSPLWNHFTLVNDDFRLASCNYCGHVARRGGDNTPKSKCVNRAMQSHITKCQPDIMNQVAREQVLLKNVPKNDVMDESVRGSVPLFNLRNSSERASFMGMVCLVCASLALFTGGLNFYIGINYL